MVVGHGPHGQIGLWLINAGNTTNEVSTGDDLPVPARFGARTFAEMGLVLLSPEDVADGAPEDPAELAIVVVG
jgi:predicted metal-dependent enzyme (double-stranded beta helix superfamily)